MCYPIEPHESKLTAQIFKLERHPQFAIYIVRVRFYSSKMKIIEIAKAELSRSMKLAAEREEYQSAGDFQRILRGFDSYEKVFTYTEIEHLQNEVHKITGNGDVMQLFNKMLGINAGS
jgi:hypothetical protein